MFVYDLKIDTTYDHTWCTDFSHTINPATDITAGSIGGSGTCGMSFNGVEMKIPFTMPQVTSPCSVTADQWTASVLI